MADIDPFASATAMRAALAAGQVSAAELADRYIRRIEQYDGRLNAVVVRDFERARQQARAADLAIARGEAGTLLGLPITLKESINVAGLGTTCGVPEWQGYTCPPMTRRRRPACARRERSSSARRMSRPCSRTGSRPIRSTGARAIRGISRVHQVAAVGAVPPRWRPG